MNIEKIFLHLAKNDNVSVEKVKSEIELAINTMWKKQTPQTKKLFPNGKPNLEEFIITLYKALESKI